MAAYPAPSNEVMEQTLILIKPDAYARGLTGEILERIERKGYVLKQLVVTHATEDQLVRHYTYMRDKPFFADIVRYMSSGPLVAAVVEGHRAIEGMRTLTGVTNPTLATAGTIRGDYGRDWGTNDMENILHSSDSPVSAEDEMAIWFPEELPTAL